MGVGTDTKPDPLPRIVIVDGDRRVQQSVSDLLRTTGRFEVVGGAGDVRAALEAVELAHPDVVLIDPRLPDLDAGIALVNGLERARPGLRVVLTGWSDTSGHSLLGSAHPRYVAKGSSPDDYVTAILDACAD